MKKWFMVFLFLFISGTIVFFNSLNNKFLVDDYVFLNNPVSSGTKFILSQWDPYRELELGIVDSFETLGYYRPMQHMVLDYCYATFKFNYWQYHLLNLFLFVLASSLLVMFVEKVSGNFNLALLTGLFCLIHPINGVIVNYITANVFAFQIIFTLSTILLLLESLERKNNRTLYFLSLLFSFLSLFWHESGVMVPFYLSVVVLLFRKDPFKKKFIYVSPYFLITFLYFVFRLFFLSINESIFKQVASFHMTAWEYLGNLFRVVMWYITRLFYPQGIVLNWVTPVLRQHLLWNCIGLILLLIVFCLLLIRFSKNKICQLSISWFIIGIAPVCLAAFIRPDLGAQIEPHWFIFSSIGFFILAANSCLFVLGRTRNGGVALLFILIFTWATVSHAYNQLWADQETYALYWSQQAPDLKFAYFYIAYPHRGEKDLKGTTRKYYRMALSGTRNDAVIYDNIGAIDQAMGHFKEAESDYKMALKIYPYSSASYFNLGAVYFEEGQLGKAKVNFDRSLTINPFFMEARNGLAFILYKNSEYQKAIDLCRKNLDIVNDDPGTLSLLVDIYIQKKDYINLKKYADRILNSISDPKELTRLGMFLAQKEYPGLAMDFFTKVLRKAPDYVDVYLAVGTLLANTGKYADAIHIWKIGLSIDPSDQRFKRSITKAEGLRSK